MEIIHNGKTYCIGDGVVTIGGKTHTVSRCEKTIPAHVVKLLKGKIPADYIWTGSALMPEVIAQAALASKRIIEGLSEIEAAVAAYERADDAYHLAIERGSCHIPAAPSHAEIDALKAMYPRAAAYRKADYYAHSHNPAKAEAGRKAMAAIMAGENYDIAIIQMQQEWSDAAAAAID
jgi:hypothetical protein